MNDSAFFHCYFKILERRILSVNFSQLFRLKIEKKKIERDFFYFSIFYEVKLRLMQKVHNRKYRIGDSFKRDLTT